MNGRRDDSKGTAREKGERRESRARTVGSSEPGASGSDAANSSAATSTAAVVDAAPRSWHTGREPLIATLAAGALFWFGSPGVGHPVGSLAGIVPLAWLVGRPMLGGRRPYVQIYLGSLLHQLAVLWFICLAHPAVAIGWIGLSIYLAIYLPLFVAATRWWHHRCGVPVWIVVPIVWAGGEWLRANLFTGFAMNLLGHAWVDQPIIIQIADLAGGYGVSAAIALWGAAIAASVGLTGSLGRFGRTAAAAALLISLGAVLGYGAWRLSGPEGTRTATIGVVQGNVPAEFPATPEAAQTYWDEIERQYRDGTRELLASLAERELPPPDLIVWPESKFTALDVQADGDPTRFTTPAIDEVDGRALAIEIRALEAQGLLDDETLDRFDPRSGDRSTSVHERFRVWFGERGDPFVPMLVGLQTARIDGDSPTIDYRDFGNSAALVGADRRVAARYSKNHLVMFGEYVPFGEALPWIYSVMPFDGGMKAGRGPTAMTVGDLVVCPSICFESTVPHLMRRQLLELQRDGTRVDALINVTDDSWFRTSAGLDLHLACNRFRAVELRRAMIVAANGGISAGIDGRGQLMVSGAKGTEARFAVTVTDTPIESLYLTTVGDGPAMLAALLSLLPFVLAIVARPGRRFRRSAAE